MNSKIILTLLLLAVISILEMSCLLSGNKSDNGNLQPCQGQEYFCGSWDWVVSCGGFGGQCFRPSTEGYTLGLELRPTRDFELFKNDTLLADGWFSIIRDDEDYMIHYETESGAWGWPQRIELHGLDTLILDDGCCDRFVRTFARKAQN